MSTFLGILPFLLTLAVALWGHWRVSAHRKYVDRVLEPLLNEAERIETRRFELENELDARIKRLLARETYWRGIASERRTDTVQDEDVSTGDSRSLASQAKHLLEDKPSESTLDLKRRLRGA